MSFLTIFTIVHVIISLIGIGSGLVVAFGMLTAKRLDGLTAVFLASTLLTSLTGFGAAASGISRAFDAWGRLLGVSDFFAAGDRTMTVQVPMGGVPTLYARTGDLFAWLCVAGLVLALGIAASPLEKVIVVEPRAVPRSTLRDSPGPLEHAPARLPARP